MHGKYITKLLHNIILCSLSSRFDLYLLRPGTHDIVLSPSRAIAEYGVHKNVSELKYKMHMHSRIWCISSITTAGKPQALHVCMHSDQAILYSTLVLHTNTYSSVNTEQGKV